MIVLHSLAENQRQLRELFLEAMFDYARVVGKPRWVALDRNLIIERAEEFAQEMNVETLSQAFLVLREHVEKFPQEAKVLQGYFSCIMGIYKPFQDALGDRCYADTIMQNRRKLWILNNRVRELSDNPEADIRVNVPSSLKSFFRLPTDSNERDWVDYSRERFSHFPVVSA